MSVAVCRSSFASILMSPEPSSSQASLLSCWLVSPEQGDKPCDPPVEKEEEEEERPGQFDIWSAIQAEKAKQVDNEPTKPYVHPLMRRSSSLLSQKSLEICTESLGSETGSDGFSSSDEMDFPFFSCSKPQEDEEDNQEESQEQEEQFEVLPKRRKGLALVNYHCSIGRRSPPRSFPPPLPSISRRDGPCLHMRPHRRDGRLVVEAVPVPSQNYLHAERHGGRLLLSFINTTPSQEPNKEKKDTVDITTELTLLQDQIQVNEDEAREEEPAAAMEQVEEAEMAEEEEEEEEVEVVDRGTVVEVKVSTQPQQQSGAAKVLRSSLVINKFVSVTPLGNQYRWAEKVAEDECQKALQHQQQKNTSAAAAASASVSPPRRLASAISTTAAAAAVAASALSATAGEAGDYGRLPQHASPDKDKKVLFTSKRRNREELLHNMRRCSELRRQLFIWEPYCIATSS